MLLSFHHLLLRCFGKPWRLGVTVWFCLASLAHAQRPLDELEFSLLDPLSEQLSGAVSSMVKCSDGFIWFATHEGVIRYDGIDARIYASRKGDPTSLVNARVNALHLDASSRLWIGTQMGISRYLPDLDQFRSYLLDEVDLASNLANNVNAIVHDANGTLYASSERGFVFRYDEDEDRFVRVNTTAFGVIKSMVFDEQDRLWIGCLGSVFRYHPRTQETRAFSDQFGGAEPSDKNFINALLVMGEDEIWVGTSVKGVLRFHPSTQASESLQTELINEHYVHSLKQDAAGRVWVSHSSGVTVYQPGKPTLRFEGSGSVGKLFGGVRCTFIDDQENVWVGTARNGIMVSTHNKRFHRILEFPGMTVDDSPIIINALLLDEQENLWVGYYSSGIDVLYRDKRPSLILRHRPGDDHSIGPNSVMALAQDRQGRILIGSHQGGFQIHDPKTGVLNTYKVDASDPNAIVGKDIRGFAEDKKGNLWVLTHGQGVSYFDVESGRFSNLRHNPLNSESSLIDDWAACLLLGHDGLLYVGTSIGLSVVDPLTLHTRNFTVDQEDPLSLSNPVVNCIYEDSRQRLWLGTNDGVVQFDIQTGHGRTYSVEQGMPNRIVVSIIEGNDGNLWIGTSKGLASLDPLSGLIRSYDAGDGLAHHEFSANAVARSQSGILYFGQKNGITWFNPKEIADNTFVPSIHLTDFKVFNQSLLPGSDLLPRSILQTESIRLKHGLKSFSIEFVALNFIQSRKNRYAYRLEGFDEDWNYLDGKREVSYTNLNPGNYTFHVKGSNNDGYWNEVPRSLKIAILPPFWMTFWFRSMVACFILLIPVAVGVLRVKRIRMENLILERTVSERTHELKTSNAQLAVALRQLESNQAQIKAQNQELQEHRSNLEAMVRLRTQELEQAKEKAEHSDRLKSAFLANMSHEIRTPMNAIMGFLEVLQFPDLNSQERQHFTRLIKQSGETLISLIDDILDLSMIEANELVVRPAPCNVHELCFDLIELLRLSMDSEKAQVVGLELHHKGRPCEGTGMFGGLMATLDPLRLKQILMNLISNGLKFTEKGKVVLDYRIIPDAAAPGKGVLRLDVRDSGIGIPEAELAHVFERFHKLEDPSGKLHRGTGLGLTISRKLAELMGGNLGVRSTVGAGSVFSLNLPVAFSHDANVPDSGAIESHSASGEVSRLNGNLPDWSRFRVLIAEDEAPNFAYLSMVLSRTGLKMEWARNGDEALEFFESEHFDLLLLDLKMPGLNGFDVTRLIRQRDSSIPIIIQSAYAMEHDRLAAREAGANAFLVKPFTIDELMVQLRPYFDA
jgi:signal transduction histidine kinase/ligand-binding sensor domain-containing protein